MISVCGECVVDLIDIDGSGTFTPVPGGSPLNIAVGLARLAVPVGLLARIGRGAMGDLLRRHVLAAGVAGHDLVATDQAVSMAMVTLDRAGVATYDFWVDGAADWQWAPGELPAALGPDVTALHVGSLAALRPPGAEAILALVEAERARGRVLISLDPNLRPALAGPHDAALHRIEGLVDSAHVVKVSTEDLAWLYPGRAAEDVLAAWHRPGRLVVVTDGDRGSRARCPDGADVGVPAVRVDLVDTVGAGDSFHAALLAGLADHSVLTPATLAAAGTGQIQAALEYAARAAAITCGRRGADPPTRAELESPPG